MDRQARQLHQAVALRYQADQDRAPKVVAKGQGAVAQRIIELARARGIPIRQDKNLVQVLSLLELDQQIPPSVYRAVAEILAFVYRLANRRPDHSSG
jgi:flagellar biosynthesis protein